MKTKTINLYEFDELSDEAKDRARDWYRQGLDYEWWEWTYDDAERIGLKITEFDLGGSKRIKGHLTESVQEVCSRILNDHGKDCDTYKLAKQWVATSDKLQALIDAKHDDEAEDERERLEDEQEENKDEFEHALLEEYFVLLDREWEYLNSTEQVDESIRSNGYTFTEDGERED